MSKLSIDQRNIKSLFQDRKSDFLIPDYQRPYAWNEEKCETLWEDLFSFAFPNNNIEKFDEDDEYFLGPIVTYQNDNKKLEVIDGQQRLTTLMLLLRAFYDYFIYAQDSITKKTREEIAKCLWKTDINDEPKLDELKIQSDVAGEDDKTEFLNILKTGIVEKNYVSNYAKNFRYFKEKIEEFAKMYSIYTATFVQIIMKNCILLPIEADDQNTALRIFSTLNDRGMPLSDADIFKAQFYKYYSEKGKKNEFITKWKELEELCNKIFNPLTGTPMDELFTRYMYYERAKRGIKSSTTEALRKFYESDNDYALLKNENTFQNLISLADFWKDVSLQNTDRFSVEVLKRLFVLNYAPNGMWNYFLSVYFMQYKDINGMLDNNKLLDFLNKTILFIWTYAITNPGVNALRTPIFNEMIKIVNNEEVDFSENKFDENYVKSMLNTYIFYNRRPITKSMITWWAFENKNQKLISLDNVFEIEHIYARKRQDVDKGTTIENLELLGNKSLLEKRINIRAAEYKFDDKKKYYIGFTTDKGIRKDGTQIAELVELANENNLNFNEADLLERNNRIIEKFIESLKENNLTK